MLAPGPHPFRDPLLDVKNNGYPPQRACDDARVVVYQSRASSVVRCLQHRSELVEAHAQVPNLDRRVERRGHQLGLIDLHACDRICVRGSRRNERRMRASTQVPELERAIRRT